MTASRGRRVAFALALLTAVAGCGTAGSDDPDARAPADVPTEPAQPTPPTPKPKPKPKATLKSCDRNIRVRAATTTCPFAQNVFYAYWLNEYEPGVFADLPGIPAYSPAAKQTFSVDCTGVSTIRCTGGDGALVTFSAASVDRYTVDDAVNYALSAELGDVPIPDLPFDAAPIDPGSEEGDGDGCNPNYAGECLDQLGDYDCQEGTGDGPNYTGEVDVVGFDEYGLDRDGDRVGCDGQ